MLIHTANFQIISMELSHLEELVKNDGKLGPMLGVKVPTGWPSSRDAYRGLLTILKRSKLQLIQGCWFFFILNHRAHELVGAAGFRGLLNYKGELELGYELTPDYLKKLPDREILLSLIRYAFTRPAVTNVVLKTSTQLGQRRRLYRGLKMKSHHISRDIIKWTITRKVYES